MGSVDTCVQCGAELGVGRFCLNCGHRIGQPALARPAPPAPPEPVVPVAAQPLPTGPAVSEAAVSEARPEPPPAEPAPAWDPHEDLLPYEEVDELESGSPLAPRQWIAWVVGAVVLVGLVVVLLQLVESDDVEDPTAVETATSAAPADTDEASPSEEEAPEEEAPEAPRGVGKRLDLAGAASFAVPATAPPTKDFDGNLVAYEADQMHDGNPATAWRMAGDGSGETITITLAEPGVVNRVGIVNGYAKLVAGVDWYPNNRRILAVTWGFEDGSTVEQTFAERPAMQLLKVPPVQTGTVTLTIASVTPPGTGPLGRDYTAISEVSIIGRRAG